MQKFRSNAQPLNNGLENNVIYKFSVELSQLFKTVRNLKIGHTLAKHTIEIGNPNRKSLFI